MNFKIDKVKNYEQAKELIFEMELNSGRIPKKYKDLYKKTFYNYFNENFINKNGILFGVFFEDNLLGIIGYVENYIEYLYVLPEYQKIGIGKSLLFTALENLKNYECVILNSTEESYEFYKNNGFIKDGDIKRFNNFEVYPMKYISTKNKKMVKN